MFICDVCKLETHEETEHVLAHAQGQSRVCSSCFKEKSPDNRKETPFAIVNGEFVYGSSSGIPPEATKDVIHYAPYGKNMCGEFDCGAKDGGYTERHLEVTCEGCKVKSPGLWPQVKRCEECGCAAPDPLVNAQGKAVCAKCYSDPDPGDVTTGTTHTADTVVTMVGEGTVKINDPLYDPLTGALIGVAMNNAAKGEFLEYNPLTAEDRERLLNGTWNEEKPQKDDRALPLEVDYDLFKGVIQVTYKVPKEDAKYWRERLIRPIKKEEKPKYVHVNAPKGDIPESFKDDAVREIITTIQKKTAQKESILLFMAEMLLKEGWVVARPRTVIHEPTFTCGKCSAVMPESCQIFKVFSKEYPCGYAEVCPACWKGYMTKRLYDSFTKELVKMSTITPKESDIIILTCPVPKDREEFHALQAMAYKVQEALEFKNEVLVITEDMKVDRVHVISYLRSRGYTIIKNCSCGCTLSAGELTVCPSCGVKP